MNWYECAILGIVAIGATIALVPLAKKIAIRFDAIDYPNERRVNTKPTPRLGGVAIFGGIFVSLIVLVLGINFWGWPSPFVSHPDLTVNYYGVGLSIVVIFVVGLIDDFKDLNPKVKFLGQIIAAIIAVCSGLLLSSIHMPFGGDYFEFGWFSYPLTVFYLVAFANIINLIDGLDGLAAGIVVISALTMFIFTVMTARPDAAVLCIILMGACLGFLVFNFHPASIFMGDSGSLLLGYLLGAISLMAIARSTMFVSLMIPIIVAGVPVVDTASAIVRRLRGHRPIDEADKGHIHHRLLETGYSQRATVIIMWTWSALLSVCAVLMMSFAGAPRYAVMVVVIVLTAVIIIKMGLFAPVLRHHYHPRGSKPNELDQDETPCASNDEERHAAGVDASFVASQEEIDG